jgi:hypothetical protein
MQVLTSTGVVHIVFEKLSTLLVAEKEKAERVSLIHCSKTQTLSFSSGCRGPGRWVRKPKQQHSCKGGKNPHRGSVDMQLPRPKCTHHFVICRGFAQSSKLQCPNTARPGCQVNCLGKAVLWVSGFPMFKAKVSSQIDDRVACSPHFVIFRVFPPSQASHRAQTPPEP